MNIYYIDYDTTQYTLYYKGYKLDKITRNVIEEYDFKKVLTFDINDTDADKYYYGTCEFKGLTTDYCIIQRYNTKKTIISYDYEIICPVTSQTVDWDTTYATFDYTGVTIIHYSDGTTSRSEEALTYRTEDFGQNISTAQKTHTYYINYNGTLQQVEVIQKKQGAITGYTYDIICPVTSKTVEWSATTCDFNYTGITIAHYDDGTTSVTNEEALIYRTPTFAQNESDFDITHNFIINFHDQFQYVEVIQFYKGALSGYTYNIVGLSTDMVDWSATTYTYYYTGQTIAVFNDGRRRVVNEEYLSKTFNFEQNKTPNRISTDYIIKYQGADKTIPEVEKTFTLVQDSIGSIIKTEYDLYVPITAKTVGCSDTSVTFEYQVITINTYSNGYVETITEEREKTFTFANNEGELTDKVWTESITWHDKTVDVEITQEADEIIDIAYEIECPITAITVECDETTAEFEYVGITVTYFKSGFIKRERENLVYVTPDFGENTDRYIPRELYFTIKYYYASQDVKVIQLQTGGYFRIKAKDNDVHIQFKGLYPGLQYSLDGVDWINPANYSFTIQKGQTLWLRGQGMGNITTYPTQRTITDDEYRVYGDIRSLFRYDDYENITLPNNRPGDFFRDTPLTNYPKLFAPVLSQYCYSKLLQGCGHLPKKIPDNYFSDITTLAPFCFFGMFANTRIEEIPNDLLPYTQLENSCYARMFSGCPNLTTVPSDLLPATNLDVGLDLGVSEGVYGSMFASCKSLTNTPELPATKLSQSCYYEMFSECTSLTSVTKIQATTMEYQSCFYMFSYCTSLTTVPNDMLQATELSFMCYSYMFYRCSALTNVPNLPATIMKQDCYETMFGECTSLTTVPSDLLPSTELDIGCYESMFNGCKALTNAPNLPATIVKESCYHNMFVDCESLTTAPDLMALVPVWGAYEGMFRRCTNLNSIKVGATRWSSQNYWVQNVSPTGTFYKPSGTDIDTGHYGIPNGWTVIDY